MNSSFFTYFPSADRKVFVFDIAGFRCEFHFDNISKELSFSSTPERNIIFSLNCLLAHQVQLEKYFNRDQMRGLILLILEDAESGIGYYAAFQLLLKLGVEYIEGFTLRKLVNKRFFEVYKMCQDFNAGALPEKIIFASVKVVEQMYPDKVNDDMLADLRNGYSISIGMNEIQVEVL